jgi:alcohol dehydrogenase class IV
VVNSFQFASTPSIIFGVGVSKDLPKTIGNFGSKILVVTGSGNFRNSPAGKHLLETIERNSSRFSIESIAGEPTPEEIDAISARYGQNRPDVVLAVGGGSVLDAGKAISAMISKADSIISFLEEVGTKNPDGTKIPFIAMPTTAGTGSETTKNAVISKIGHDGFKKSLRHDNYIPNVAIVDPQLTLSCSKHVTASSGLDAFTQLLEAYVSPKSSAMIDALAFDGLQNVVRSLKRAWESPDDIEARTGMSYAAMLSGIALANAGLGSVHGFASSVGGFFPIPHGVVCGTLMAECAAVNVKKLAGKQNPAYFKYAQVGRLMTEKSNETDQYYCDLLIDSLFRLTDEMNIPRLSAFGVKHEHIAEIVAVTGNKNNPVALSSDDMSLILENRI